MKILGVIPARFGSTRFEGKPLKPIAGKPLLQWVIEGALQAKRLSEVWVATDHPEIADLAGRCGVKSVMTDAELPSGSDRVWAAVKSADCEGVINIQGDEPLIQGQTLDVLARALEDQTEMVTLARKFSSIDELKNPHVAKVVVDRFENAIYFSRLPIPYSRESGLKDFGACYKHIGLYGYSKAFLGQFCDQKPTKIELAEGLEQLRALWLGARIKVILTEIDSWGVDTPEDVIRVEEILKRRR